MVHFVFSEKDTRYLFLKCDNTQDEYIIVKHKGEKNPKPIHIFKALKEHINLVDPMCYRPTYTGVPFTRDYIFDYVQPSGVHLLYCSIGLWQVIYKYLKENNVPYDGLEAKWFKRDIKHTFDEFKEIVNSWGMSRTPRPYQYEAAYNILQWNKSVSQLATRAGKTLIAYMVFRYCTEYLSANRILMIVPSISLVKQGCKDFDDYAEFFNTEMIWGGGELRECANMTIGTFQSLIGFLDKTSKKYNPSFFEGYDIVFVDETHRANANQIKTIISQPFMLNVKIAFGMTGTVPKPHTIEHYGLHALLGAQIQTITPRELMDAGYISDIFIHQVRLNYKNYDKQLKLFIRCAEYALSETVMEPTPKNPNKKRAVKLPNPEFLIQNVKKMPDGLISAKAAIKANNVDYPTNDLKIEAYVNLLHKLISSSISTNALVVEKMMIHFMEERVTYLCEEILSNCKYNTLVLAHHTEYIKYLVEEVTKRMPDKIICTITGGTGAKQREQVMELLKNNNNCVLIASYGCVGTGITLSDLCFGVLFESFKSDVLNMQSLGRGLGLSEHKDRYIVYDMIDCFDKMFSKNAVFRQGKEKIKIYEENQYDYDIINKDIY